VYNRDTLLEREVFLMSENTNVTDQTAEHAAESGDIMQHIQDMIGSLLQNTVDKMHKTEMGDKLGEAPDGAGDSTDPSAQMGIVEIKNFVDVMQKFIDNVNVMVLQLETGSSKPGETDDKFLEGYMATADNILEIAAFSAKDKATGLSNRYGFDNRLILEWNRAARDKSTLGLVIFGIDAYSDFEDTKKHNDLLKAVSETLEKSIKRSTDFIARWNDDDGFAALLPITDKPGVSIVVERISTEIGNINIPGVLKDGAKITVSIGYSVHQPEPYEQPADFINNTHDAYNKAREAGGNKIIFVE